MSADKSTWKRWLIAALAAGLGAGAAAAVHAAASTTTAPPRSAGEPPSYAASISTGPGMTSDAAIRSVVSRLSGAGVESATLAEPEAGEKSARVRVQVAGSEEDVRRVWLGGLAEGAIADSMRTDGERINNSLSGGTVTSSDGEEIDLGGSAVVGGQRFGSPADDRITARIDAAAEKFNLRVKRVVLLHPVETAAEVTLVAPDDLKPTWTLDELRSAITGDPTDLEGLYLRLETGSGTPLLESGAAYRIGGGGLWFAEGQDARFGAVHGGRATIDTSDTSR